MPQALIIIEAPDDRAARTEAQGRELYAKMVAFGEGLQQRGLLLGVESLLGHDEAARVQVRDGQSRLVDGPFTEAKEMIGGFFLLDTDDRALALKLAAECPAAQWATVEVRSLGPCFVGSRTRA
jgi:hypothetical protein